ncbi:Gag-pol fusion protein [Phytophthora megakarya]|uniref:Gag-pol fusion protein n=1 Tax=Phytophthora megakarya TaxID=4795 RepID=A0A225WEG6_9STRA|nr:Gag-pol fusion protein [Phytophthora megakarya]
MAPHYTVKNGILMRRVHLHARAGPARTTLVPVIPLPFIEMVLHYCHADLLSSHSGTTKTIDKVRKHAYWLEWKRDVVEYVRACYVCGSGKGYRPWKNGLMQRPIWALSRVVGDAIGPLVTAPRGNKYILVFADYFTRWVETFPVKKLDIITFVNLMVDEVVSRHGVPERLLSDRGPNFISNLAMSFYQTLGIKKCFGAAYHPQTQGLIERFNGTLLGMLRMFVGETHEGWDLYLPRVLFAYRTSYHKALGDSPLFSLYGRDSIFPLDLAFLNTRREWKSNEVAGRATKSPLFLSMRDSRRMVERQLLKAQGRRERRPEGQEAVTFAEDDAVWIYQYFRAMRGERKTKKLERYRVAGRLGHNAYRIAIPTHPNRVVELILVLGSMTTRITVDDEETVFSGVSHSVVDNLAKRKLNGDEQYLVLTASYEVCWRRTASLLPTYKVPIDAFKDEGRLSNDWPELRRSARLAEANAAVDEDELFLAVLEVRF